jgi:hypothetical protein
MTDHGKVHELKHQDAVSQFKVHKQELFALKHVMIVRTILVDRET